MGCGVSSAAAAVDREATCSVEAPCDRAKGNDPQAQGQNAKNGEIWDGQGGKDTGQEVNQSTGLEKKEAPADAEVPGSPGLTVEVEQPPVAVPDPPKMAAPSPTPSLSGQVPQEAPLPSPLPKLLSYGSRRLLEVKLDAPLGAALGIAKFPSMPPQGADTGGETPPVVLRTDVVNGEIPPHLSDEAAAAAYEAAVRRSSRADSELSSRSSGGSNAGQGLPSQGLWVRGMRTMSYMERPGLEEEEDIRVVERLSMVDEGEAAGLQEAQVESPGRSSQSRPQFRILLGGGMFSSDVRPIQPSPTDSTFPGTKPPAGSTFPVRWEQGGGMAGCDTPEEGTIGGATAPAAAPRVCDACQVEGGGGTGGVAVLPGGEVAGEEDYRPGSHQSKGSSSQANGTLLEEAEFAVDNVGESAKDDAREAGELAEALASAAAEDDRSEVP